MLRFPIARLVLVSCSALFVGGGFVSHANANPNPLTCGGTCPTSNWSITGNRVDDYEGQSFFTGVLTIDIISRDRVFDAAGRTTTDIQSVIRDQQRQADSARVGGTGFQNLNATGTGALPTVVPSLGGLGNNFVPRIQGATWNGLSTPWQLFGR